MAERPPVTAYAMKTARRGAAFVRRQQAVKMRVAGATYEQIAVALGYTDRSNAHRAVESALRNHWNETATDRQQLIQRELMTLDAMQYALFPIVLGRDADAAQKAAARIVRIMERRARMTGIDAPTKIELTDEMDRAIKELGQQLAEDPTWDVDAIEGVAGTETRAAIEGGPSGGDPD